MSEKKLGKSIYLKDMEVGKQYCERGPGGSKIFFEVAKKWKENDQWFIETTTGQTHMMTDGFEHYGGNYYTIKPE